jgi:serine/threonine-protein kinase
MQIRSADALVQALGESGLFTPRDVAALTGELTPLGDDPDTLIRFLVENERIPIYQLRKVIHGKVSDLFIGHYVVVDKIGEGGMGKVFRARDSRTGRTVALKVVRSHLISNPTVRGRFEREVKAAEQLDHPNIVALLDAGEIEGKYFLAMEFVDGVDLTRLIRQFGVLPIPEACEYLRQAALGLEHAHARGFVHRDIKPSNIVVSGERHLPDANEPAVVKILDMGLVRSPALDESTGISDLTRAGTVLGTPDYISPEQGKNSSQVDHRADQYSLGATFYFLVTGKPPFPVGSAVEKIIQHQVDPPPPLQAVRPDVSDELARVIGRLLAKRPEDRFESAGDIAKALAPFAEYRTGNAVVEIRDLMGMADFSCETLPSSSPTIYPMKRAKSVDRIEPLPLIVEGEPVAITDSVMPVAALKSTISRSSRPVRKGKRGKSRKGRSQSYVADLREVPRVRTSVHISLLAAILSIIATAVVVLWAVTGL